MVLALVLAAKCQLPSSEKMLQNIEETQNQRKDIYYHSINRRFLLNLNNQQNPK